MCMWVCVCVQWMKWYIIFIIYDIVELFNMHKSFSFYLNIKFFAHKILNALSFQWFRFFGYMILLVIVTVGCLVFRYHFVFTVWVRVRQRLNAVRSRILIHILIKMHTLLLLIQQAAEWCDFDVVLLHTVLPLKFISIKNPYKCVCVCALHRYFN